MTTADDKAHEEALTRYPEPEDNLTLRSIHTLLREGFTEGAAWQREQSVEITDEMVDTIQEAVYDDCREGDRAIIRAALEAALNGGEA
jgi:hypothetical protein